MGAALEAVPSEPEGAEGTAIVFDNFFRDTYEALYRALCLVTGNGHEAEDVMQVAYMRVFERWD